MRIFTGMPLPPTVIEKTAGCLKRLKVEFSGLKFVKPENLHITLHFFGETDHERVKLIKQAMDGLKALPPVVTQFGGLGFFPPRGLPRVFYLSLSKGADQLTKTYFDFMGAMKPLGYQSQREFVPHITLARNKTNKRYDLQQAEGLYDRIFELNKIVLFESRLKPQGAVYVPLKLVELKQA